MSDSIVSQNDLEAQMIAASEALADLADGQADEEVAGKLMSLATAVSPQTKGIEAKQTATIPQINIKQKMSTNDAIPQETSEGQMYTTQSDHIGDEVVILPILTHDIRRMWGDSNNIECQSLDGERGNRYGECNKCPHGKYVEGERMQCSKGTTYYVTDEDFSGIYKINFLKTSARAGRTIRRLARPPSLWSRKFHLSTEKQKGSQGVYYTFETRAGDKTSAEERQICDKLYDFFKPNYERAKLVQQAYVNDSGNAESAPKTIIIEDGDEVPDFSDSM